MKKAFEQTLNNDLICKRCNNKFSGVMHHLFKFKCGVWFGKKDRLMLQSVGEKDE